MQTISYKYRAVAFVATALIVGAAISGCVTKRDIDTLQEQVGRVEEQNKQVLAAVTRMDSLTVSGSESDTRLRNELRTSVNELQSQIAKLLENYNELAEKIDKLGRGSSRGTVGSSPGVQPGGPGALPQVNAECQNMYDSAFVLMRAGNYDNAIVQFQKFQQACPTSENVGDAVYWIGESYYQQKKYVEAFDQFQGLVNNFKSSERVRQALYKMARSKQELGKPAEAKKLYQQVINEFGNTLEAEQSKERLKDLK